MLIKQVKVDLIECWSNDTFLGSVTVEAFGDSVWISMLFVPPEFRRQGVATKLLETVSERFPVDICMEPMAFCTDGPTTEQLVEWYTKLGFEKASNIDSIYVKRHYSNDK